MPLTKKGEELLHKFEEEYGKKKGESIFYAWEHKHKDRILKEVSKVSSF